MSLSNSIQYLKGVGPARQEVLARLGIYTIEDLLYFFPRRYEDRSQLTPIKDVQINETYTICGDVLVKGIRRFRGRSTQMFEMAVGEKNSRIFAAFFNQTYLDKYFRVGQKVILYGKVELFNRKLQMVNPEFEILSGKDESLNVGRIVPIYPLTQGVTQNYLRKVIRYGLDQYLKDVQETLPHNIVKKQKIAALPQTIEQMHFPDSLKEQEKANKRVAFEEFFLFQLAVISRRSMIKEKKGFSHTISEDLIQDYQRLFPFQLTQAQNKVVKSIIKDMQSDQPMLRLLQGDVGCGKTPVSFFGCLVAFTQGLQSAIMAPTEILAEQHFYNLQNLINNSSFKHIKVALLNSALKKSERAALLHDIQKGKIHCVVGTHALLQEDVAFKDLSYVVIDEQHKFGVKQRAVLASKGVCPDVLVMTATPIPRTLCLTLYGDLDVSVIDEMPKGRGKIDTYVFEEPQSQSVYDKVKDIVKKGTQAYVIYPLVEESEKLDLKSAKDMFKQFQQGVFKNFRLALVHGQMKKEETQKIMQSFKQGDIDILVATTVLEVGIDVANANVMIVEHAERFGLSQLHQLRGRIGRGTKNAVCILIANVQTEAGKARLDAIKSTTDGFKIAQQDLNIRGPGQYFGRQQHGINDFRMVNPLTEMALLEKAREEALAFMQQDPSFLNKDHAILKAMLKRRFPQYTQMVQAG